MSSHDRSDAAPSPADIHAAHVGIPQLVGRIYDAAPMPERRRILEHLLRPLGALVVVGVCNGIFTKIWFRNGWSDLYIRAEDVQSVQGIDVIALVDYVQQASVDTIGGLASMLAASPMIVYSAATAMLVSILIRRLQSRRNGARKAGKPAE
jgi:hypothetical protein